MLAPALGTLLVVITTDAEISAPDLQTCLQKAHRADFDRIDSMAACPRTTRCSRSPRGPPAPSSDLNDFTTNLARVCWSLEAAAHRRCRRRQP
jgi:glutamate N-acetyltransferase/amino-acid N-acetyltransferase